MTTLLFYLATFSALYLATTWSMDAVVGKWGCCLAPRYGAFLVIGGALAVLLGLGLFAACCPTHF